MSENAFDWMYYSECSENGGLTTLIEPWKEDKAAEQYESRGCETVGIIWFNHPLQADTNRSE